MIDTHCHIDLYPDPSRVAADAEKAGITTVVVTNLPSAFDRAYPHIRPLRHIRLALGFHPLVAEQHAAERKRFQQYVDRTSYVGEIGLDFSSAGRTTKQIQLNSFRFVLETLRGKARFVTLHSRGAESTVVDLLEEYDKTPVVFHWYSGSLDVLHRALEHGHYFSINPAMLRSTNGNKIIAAIPPERALTETDGPFVEVGKRPAQPSDVLLVEANLAQRWQVQPQEAAARMKENFMTLVRPLRAVSMS